MTFSWSSSNVSAKSVPNLIWRTHEEWQQVKNVLYQVNPSSILDYGCGFGRLFPVYFESIPNVTVWGFEPEASMRKDAERLWPAANIVGDVKKLDKVTGDFDLGVSFTVLQHMSEPVMRDAVRVLEERCRNILLVEDTDPRYYRSDHGHLSVGRTVAVYRGLMQGFTLSHIALRRNEPGYTWRKEPKPTAGHYMLFTRDA